ncbi:MAG: hypothetical protein KDK36_20790 [Leptospiraceae bacterium]|nr:hypothetical protein [Leptospiraceae bacterium]
MAKPESNDLITQIKSGIVDDYRKNEKEKLTTQISSDTIKLDLEKIKLVWEDMESGILKEGVISALLGALYGFHDRELDPFHPQHHQIFKHIRSDIEEAFESVKEGNKIDEDLWLFETFDYGIKNIYYLDWQLYLSKICY